MSISPPPKKRARLVEHSEEHSALAQQLTIYSWNVNGIDPLVQTTLQDYWKRQATSQTPPSPIREFLRRHGWPTLCCLQEIKVRPEDDAKLRAIRRAVSNTGDRDLPDYEAHFCLPSRARYPRAWRGKLYGVCTLVRKDFAQGSVERIRQVTWDDEGRILVLETKASSNTMKLAIINVYLVNGTDLPYRSTTSGDILGTRHDRKLEVHKLLQTECQELEAQAFRVIIAGDINIARSHLDGHPHLRTHPHQHVLNRVDFEQRFFSDPAEGESPVDITMALKMVDTYRMLHPTSRGYTYFSRAAQFGHSCDRVDMIITSRTIASACKEAGMHQTIAERATSDHVPLFARFLFDSTRNVG